jgi:hypothetical protein
MPDLFSLSARGFATTVLIAGGGVSLAEGAGCPGEVPATAMVTTSAEVVDRSVPAVFAEPPTGTSSPANAVLTTFRRLGSGGEEEGPQHRQSKHPTITKLDNSTRWRSYTWWVRLCLLGVCVPLDDHERLMVRLLPTPRMMRGSGSYSPSLQPPSPVGASRSRLSRHWMIEPFSLQLRLWGEGGMVRGCWLVVDNSGTMPCVPAEDS